MLQQQIEKRLHEAFTPEHLEVINESHQHSGPATESHFKVVLVSSAFNDMKLIQRHRAVNEALQDLLGQFHALALHTYTPEEWAKKGAAPASPRCQGGAKRA
ncbi:MAG TPA: BolA/IbaG family iron-sulfur metabolism protein [Piscirickettsiaceae bacterium]|nr:BolA/IbaG family iron-sulfur metabolism protein [Piscirickettsiaceae bacterium]HIQ40255.1 BolA/IbaG family iron-sulfur metabolism protein [Sulfurivirga caldicuralii]